MLTVVGSEAVIGVIVSCNCFLPAGIPDAFRALGNGK